MSNFVWKHDRRFNDYSSHVRNIFNRRVQKISIDAGFSCPNRDGNKSYGGCTFCNNSTFNPVYCGDGNSITNQIDTGIEFFTNSKKYKTQYYLAYFQAYTNTYDSLDVLKQRYEEALSDSRVVGLVIGTRPDCVSDELLAYLSSLSKKYYITIEYGVESTNNATLGLINRGHDYETSVETIIKTNKAGINVGVHLILGLPDETDSDILNHAKAISKLPINYLKLHQLQLVKGSTMGAQFLKGDRDMHLYSAEEYIEVVIDFIELLNPEIIIERFISQSPKDLLLAPKWGNLKNFEFVAKLDKRLEERNTWQGRLY